MLSIQRPAPPRTPVVAVRPSPTQAEPLVEYGLRRVLIVAGVMLAALLQMIDTTIVNVSLPTIQGNLGATVDEAIWVVTAFVVANVVVIPITPWLQRRFGRKNYFLASIAGFTIAYCRSSSLEPASRSSIPRCSLQRCARSPRKRQKRRRSLFCRFKWAVPLRQRRS